MTNLRCEITNTPYDEGSFSDRVHRYIRSRNKEELNQNFNGVVKNLNEFVAFFEGLIWELSAHLEVRAEEIYSSINNQQEDAEYKLYYQKWDRIGQFILQHQPKLSYLSLRLYQRFLQTVKTLQRPPGKRAWKRIHKGGIFHNMGLSLLFLDQKENAKSYFILGLIEDMFQCHLGNASDFRGPGYMNLKSLKVFQEEERELNGIESLVKERVERGIEIEIANPEFIFLDLLSSSKYKINVSQFLLWDNLFLKMLIREVKGLARAKKHETNKVARAKYNKSLRQSLESLATYLFFTTERFEVNRNIKTIHAEHDLRVRNLIVDDPILELLGRYILVECKNWEKLVDSTRVKKFISNIRFAQCNTGILLTRIGVTGEKRKDSAWYVIRAEYHKDEVIVIVLTMNDVLKIADEKVSFLEMLKTKYEKIRFDEN